MSKRKKQHKKTAPTPSTPPTGFPGFFSNSRLLAGILFAVSVLIYAGTFTHGFVQDDAIVITENDFTKAGDIGSLLRYDTFRGFFKVEGKDGLVQGGRYRPLTPVYFAFLWKISPNNPMVFHILNVLWYGLTVVTLFVVMLRLLQGEGESYVRFVAFVTALLFAVHPVHTEVVANIKGLDEIMTLLLSLVALLLSLQAFDGKSAMKMVAAGLVFFFALMAKEMAVVFIPVIAIAFWVFRKATLSDALLQTIPHIVGFGAFMGIRMWVLGDAGGGASLELMNNPFLRVENKVWVDFTHTGDWFGTIMYTLGKYLQLLVLPYSLTHDYYPYAIPITGMGEPTAVISILIHTALAGLAAYGVFHRKHWGFGIAFYLVALFLVSNIPLTIGVNMAERFIFMPSVGFCIVVATLLYGLAKRWNAGGPIVSFAPLRSALLLVGGLALLASAKTVRRSLDWKSNFTLFSADWEKSENSAKIRNAMGGELTRLSQGTGVKGTPKEQEMLREALSHLEATTRIHPTYKGAFLLKGNAFLYLGDYDTAIRNYDHAVSLDPDFTDALNNRDVALKARKEQREQEDANKIEQQAIAASNAKDFATAIRLFSQLRNQYPDIPKYHFFIGVTYLSANDMEAALRNFLKAEAVDNGADPKNTRRIHQALADVYARLGNAEKAEEYKRKWQ